jgi:hypothetical protein
MAEPVRHVTDVRTPSWERSIAPRLIGADRMAVDLENSEIAPNDDVMGRQQRRRT